MADPAPQFEIKRETSAVKPLLPAQPVRVDALLPLTTQPPSQSTAPANADSGTMPAVTMVIRFVCLHCGVQLSVPESKVGKWVRCKACEHRVKVPHQTPVPGQPRMTERRVDQHLRRRRRKARPEQPTRFNTHQTQPPTQPPQHSTSNHSPHTAQQPSPQPSPTPRYKLKSLSPDNWGTAPTPAPVQSINANAQAESILVVEAPVQVRQPSSRFALAQRVTDVLTYWVDRLSRSRPATLPASTTTTMAVMLLYGDLMVTALLAGVLWWALVWFTGLELTWLALLPGVALGMMMTLHMKQRVHDRLRPALAITGVTLLLVHLLILGTTQTNHEARLLADDVHSVRRAVILNLIDQQQVPGDLQQTIAQNGWYNPQSPDDFFDRVTPSVYSQLETIAQPQIANMSRGQVHRTLAGYLRNNPEFSIVWSRRIERLNWVDGVLGLLSMSFAAGLPMVMMKWGSRPSG